MIEFMKRKKSFLILCVTAALLISFTCCGQKAVSVSSSANTASAAQSTDEITQVDTAADVSKESYADFFKAGKAAFLVPGLKNGLVPQGMCYIHSKSLFVISCYSDSSGTSMLLLIDANNGKFTKAVKLLNEDGSAYTGHAGGLAASENSLWVVTSEVAQRLQIDDLMNAKSMDEIKFTDRFHTGTRASMANCVDNVLWVGDFYEKGGKYNTEESHHMKTPDGTENHAWVVGFKLDTANKNELKASAYQGPSKPSTPDYILSIPDRIQGITQLKSGEFALSQSYGRNNDSSLLIYKSVLDSKADSNVKINGTDVPLWYLDSKTLVKNITAPPMLEALEQVDGNIYTLFESGCNLYRDTAKNPMDEVYQLNLQ